MANPSQDRPQKRARGPNIETVIAAAAKAGRHLVGIVSRPGGVTEYRFGPAGDAPVTAIDDPA